MSFKSFGEYVTEATKEITFTFGRFNPPTIGHEKLLDAAAKVARGSKQMFFASQSTDTKKNPLDYTTKIKHMRKMFPRHARSVVLDKSVRNVFDILVKIYDQGYNRATMVVGSDRVSEFEALIGKYNGVKGRHGFYNFEGGVTVISAGERDPDSEGVSGMSASKMRAAAEANDFSLFTKGLPKGFKDGKQLFNDLRSGLGLKESHDYRQHIQLQTVSEEREAYIQGELFEKGDMVAIKESEEVGTVAMLGSNYVIVETSSGKKLRKWLDSVEKLEEACWDSHKQVGMKTKNGKQVPNCVPKEETEDPDIGDRKGSQPANYHKGLAKSTKTKRDAQFKKQAKMDDDDPKAYKPAPGDKTAETKPSKHTKKYNQMYGEDMKSFSEYQVQVDEDASKGLKAKAEKSGMPVGILRQVYNRGVAAWKTGHRPGTTPQQWGFARVNSFVTKSSGTWGKADKDLAAKVRS